jgi:hydroxymethylpyrimidine pyrophosphatase-like HAD family hydrolase
VTSAPPTTARKLVFLDVDGTFADHGVVPAGHVAAVRAARAAGHRVLLCTGRPTAMLPARILEAGFDGVVASAGGYVELGGEVLVDTRFPDELAARTVAVLDAHGAAYVLEAPDALYGRPGVDRRLTELLRGHLRAPGTPADRPLDILADLRMSDDLTGCSFAKVTYFAARSPREVLLAEIGDAVGILPSSLAARRDTAGEIYLRDVHKARGIEAVTARLGVDRADVIAFGDGLNDLEMLAHAGVGVAIEGADPRLLAVADRVAAGPDREGLVAAFADLGLTG